MRTNLVSLLLLFFSLNLYASEACDIFVHGFTKNKENYFGDLPRQVRWDSTKEIEVSAPEVARKILDEMNTCPIGEAIVLRPHSYGASQVHYILGKGLLFQDAYPDHPFVQVYKRTVEVYAYTGAYHGTPIMDLICSNKLTHSLGSWFGKSCVKSLTTSLVDNVSSKITNPGVVTQLISSTNRSGYSGITGSIIASHMVNFLGYLIGVRNQNDNTLPLYATRACAEKQLMPNQDSNCKKLDSNYFVDFHHTNRFHHFQFLRDKDFMQMTKNE